MGDSARLAVQTTLATYAWCTGCGWSLPAVRYGHSHGMVSRAATDHATSNPDHEVHLTTYETTIMQHVRWQTNQPATT